MAILKIKNEHGTWDDIPALRGRDGAIQYTAGANIEISSDNVISARGLENTVTRDDVSEMISEAVPTDVSDLTNDAGYVTSNDIPTKTSDLINDGMGDSRGLYGYAAVFPRDSQYPWGISIEGQGTTQNPYLVKPIIADVVVNKPLAFKDEIPTALSALTNDTNFITSSAIPADLSDFNNDSGFITSSDLPTKLSDLTNDTNYTTSTELNLSIGQLETHRISASDLRIASSNYNISEADKKILLDLINEVLNPADIPTTGPFNNVKVKLNKTVTFNVHLPATYSGDISGNITGSEIYDAGYYGLSQLLKVSFNTVLVYQNHIELGINPDILSIGSGPNLEDRIIHFPVFCVTFNTTSNNVDGITALNSVSLNTLQKNRYWGCGASSLLSISKAYENKRLIHSNRGAVWITNSRVIKPTELTDYATDDTLEFILNAILQSNAGSLYGESIILKDSDLDTNFKNIVLAVYDGSETTSVYNTYGGVTYYTHTATIKLYDKYPKSGESVYELIIEFTWNDYSYYVDSITNVTNNGWITVS